MLETPVVHHGAKLVDEQIIFVGLPMLSQLPVGSLHVDTVMYIEKLLHSRALQRRMLRNHAAHDGAQSAV
jgi:hypothetical protein